MPGSTTRLGASKPSGTDLLSTGDDVISSGLDTVDAAVWIYQGGWDSATAYAVNDVVDSAGVKYLAILAGTNHEPPNATYWEPLSADLTTETAARVAGDTTRVPNNQTTDYTLVLTDAGKVVEVNAATGKTVTIPTNASVAFPTNTIVWVQQLGAGAVTVAGAGGVTVSGATLVTNGVGSGLLLRKTATNTWVVMPSPISSSVSGGQAFIQTFGITPRKSNVNWNTPVITANVPFNVTIQSSGAQNDEIVYSLPMDAGTWDLSLVYSKGTAFGIATIQVDGVTVATVDQYAAAPAYGVVSTTTGITVATTGDHDIRIVMASKNASASAYYGDATSLILRRTGN